MLCACESFFLCSFLWWKSASMGETQKGYSCCAWWFVNRWFCLFYFGLVFLLLLFFCFFLLFFFFYLLPPTRTANTLGWCYCTVPSMARYRLWSEWWKPRKVKEFSIEISRLGLFYHQSSECIKDQPSCLRKIQKVCERKKCAYACVCACVCVHVHVHVRMRVCTCMCVRVRAYAWVCMCVCARARACACVCTCMCVRVRAYAWVCMCVQNGM